MSRVIPASAATSSRLVAANPARANARVAAARICSRRSARRRRRTGSAGTAVSRFAAGWPALTDVQLLSCLRCSVHIAWFSQECIKARIQGGGRDNSRTAAVRAGPSAAARARAGRAAGPGPGPPVRTAAGDPTWLVAGYQQARRLLVGPRLGRSHPDPARNARTGVPRNRRGGQLRALPVDERDAVAAAALLAEGGRARIIAWVADPGLPSVAAGAAGRLRGAQRLGFTRDEVADLPGVASRRGHRPGTGLQARAQVQVTMNSQADNMVQPVRRRHIGALGTIARLALGGYLAGSVIYGHIVRGFHLLPWVEGLIIFPAVVLL